MTKKNKAQIAKERREWVNKEFAKKTQGRHMSNSRKTRELKRLWRKVKKEIK